MRHRFIAPLAMLAAAISVPAGAGTLQALKNPAPDGVNMTMLMTDGTVLAQGFGASDWWKLTPDNNGSYINGTWKRVASMPNGYAPDATAESVLADGRLVIAGGEYNQGNFSFTNTTVIYDPVVDKWTDI